MEGARKGGEGAERGLVPTNLAKSQPTHRHYSTRIRAIVRVFSDFNFIDVTHNERL
jgi:hypothetical protein